MNAGDESGEPAPLRADAQRLLAHWRAADDMPAAARARVWRRLADAPAGRAAATTAAANTGWMWVLAIAAALVLAWWTSAQLRRGVQDGREADHDAAVDARDHADADGRARVGVPSPALPPAELPAEALPAMRSAAPTPVAPAKPAPRGRAAEIEAPSAVPPGSTLDRERAVLERAWQALAAADPGTALQRAAEHEREFPRGVLAPERRAITVIARCTRGDRDATARAQRWLEAEPRSLLETRVRAACRLP